VSSSRSEADGRQSSSSATSPALTPVYHGLVSRPGPWRPPGTPAAGLNARPRAHSATAYGIQVQNNDWKKTRGLRVAPSSPTFPPPPRPVEDRPGGRRKVRELPPTCPRNCSALLPRPRTSIGGSDRTEFAENEPLRSHRKEAGRAHHPRPGDWKFVPPREKTLPKKTLTPCPPTAGWSPSRPPRIAFGPSSRRTAAWRGAGPDGLYRDRRWRLHRRLWSSSPPLLRRSPPPAWPRRRGQHGRRLTQSSFFSCSSGRASGPTQWGVWGGIPRALPARTGRFPPQPRRVQGKGFRLLFRNGLAPERFVYP